MPDKIRDDAEYWDALSARLVKRIRDRRSIPVVARVIGMRLTWQPLVAAAIVLALVLARFRPVPGAVATGAPNVAALIGPPGRVMDDRPPSVAALLVTGY